MVTTTIKGGQYRGVFSVQQAVNDFFLGSISALASALQSTPPTASNKTQSNARASGRRVGESRELHTDCCFIAIIIDLPSTAQRLHFYTMFLIRLIILLAIVAALMWLLKRLFSSPPEAQRLETDGENMRQCKYCGVHVPESSILKVGDQPYCCQEHADLDQP